MPSRPRTRPPGRKQTRLKKPDRLLEVGAVRGPHGLKGTVTIYSHTRPAIGIAGYFFWWLGESAEQVRAYRVRRCWRHGRRLLAELEGVVSVAEAEMLAGRKIWVDAADVERGPEEYLWQDLIGCEVRDAASGRLIGTVIALQAYGAQDILTVRTPGGEWMLPFVRDVVCAVDLDARRIAVRFPEGMDACFTPRS